MEPLTNQLGHDDNRRPRWRHLLVRYGAGAGLLAYLCFLVVRVVVHCDGGFSYALDDAYIHMGLARHVAEQGVWGVGDGFASAASSVLWPLALALVYWIKGPDLYTPLVFQFAGVLALFAAIYCIVERDYPSWSKRGWPAGLAMIAVALAAPVNTLVLSGLEHIWHLVATLLVIDRGALAFAVDTPSTLRRRAERQLLWLAPLLTLVRFETIALVPALAALALLGRRFRLAIGIILGAILPLLAFGWWSQWQGGYFWPNSLVLKAVRHAPDQPVWAQARALYFYLKWLLPQQPTYSALLALSFCNFAIACAVYRQVRARAVLLLGLFLVQGCAHASFGAFGWLFRYEAYALALGVFANLHFCARIWFDVVLPRRSARVLIARWPARLALLTFCGLSVILVYSLSMRTRDATRVTPRAARNIYEQQVQFGQFLRQYYPKGRVALNDIGAASYFADIHLLDLFGLGSNSVARSKMAGTFTQDGVAQLAQDHAIEIAIVYDSWFAGMGGMPKTWTKVGEWEIRGNVVCGSPIVSFYAVKPEHIAALQRNLADFSDDLPVLVLQRGSYLKLIPGLAAGSEVYDRTPAPTTDALSG